MTEKPGSESRRRGLEEIPVRSLHVDFDGSGRGGGPDIDKHLRKLSSFPSPSALEKAEPRLLLSCRMGWQGRLFSCVSFEKTRTGRAAASRTVHRRAFPLIPFKVLSASTLLRWLMASSTAAKEPNMTGQQTTERLPSKNSRFPPVAWQKRKPGDVGVAHQQFLLFLMRRETVDRIECLSLTSRGRPNRLVSVSTPGQSLATTRISWECVPAFVCRERPPLYYRPFILCPDFTRTKPDK